MTELKWFGVQTVYEHDDLARGQDRLYEERVVLIRATSQDEALLKAEQEAEKYGSESTRFLGYLMCYEMYDEPGEGYEVFSLMRTSRMAPTPYINRFYDTGRERSRSWTES